MGVENNIPEGWTESVLGDVMDIFSGKSRPKDNGIYPVYGGNGIHSYGDKYNQQNETLIIGRVGAYCGNVYKENNKFWLSDNALGVKSNEDSDLNYLYYKLKSMKLNNVSIGAAQPLLTQSLLKELEVIIPKKTSEQKAIAKVLTAFDDKIELLQAQNKTLESMAQIIFKEWFGKYTIGDELPEGWRVGKITELFEVRDGTHDSPKETKNGKQLITSRHVSKERVKFEESYFISDDDYNAINKRSKVDQFDILFSMIGTLGLTYYEQNAYIDYAIKNLALFKTSQRKEYSIYTYLWLTGIHGKHYVLKNKSGSTQEFMSLGSLRNIEFVIPSDQNLIDFNSLCEPIFKKIKINSSQIQSLTKTRDTLLPKLMSGQVRVNNLKQTVDA